MIYFARAELATFQPRRDGMIRNTTLCVIKIGYAEKLKDRLRELRDVYGVPVEFIGVMPGARERERLLHKKFARYRFDHDRMVEWFFPAKEILDFVKIRCVSLDTVMTMSYI